MSNEDESMLQQDLPMSSNKKVVLLVACCLILGVAYYVTQIIISTGPKPKKRKAEEMLPKVKVEPVVFSDQLMEMSLNGTVEPSKKLSLKAEVSGLIVKVNPNVEVGRFVKKGEILFELEDTDYKSLLASRQADLAKAQMELEVEKGRQALSKQEWELVQLEAKASDQEKKLALRKPQLAMAMANEKAARSAVELAKKNLERTKIKVPFDAVIIEQHAELGARISTQEELLMLAKSQPYWVRVTLPLEKLAWLEFEKKNNKGSPAAVTHLSSEEVYQGQVLRYLPNMMESTRMAQVLVEVNPNQNKVSPLLLGSYVRVNLSGKAMKDVVKVSRDLLQEGSFLHVLTSDDRLDLRKVHYLSSGRDHLLITSGLKDGDRLIVSQIPAPVEGMKLSVSQE